MKLTKLLTGAAVAALLTGAANAQITVGDVDAAATAQDFAETQAFASEFTGLATAGVTGNLEFAYDVTSAGAGGTGLYAGISAAERISIRIDLTGGLTFDGPVQDGDEIGDGAGCSFTVVSGGADNSQSVTFQSVVNPTVCSDNATDIEFDLDLNVTDAGNFTVTSLNQAGDVLLATTHDGNAANVALAPGLVTRAAGATVSADANQGVVEIDNTNVAGLRFVQLEANNDAVLEIDITHTGALVDFGTAFDLDTATADFDLVITAANPSGLGGFELNPAGVDTVRAFGTSNPNTSTFDDADLVATDWDATDTWVIEVLDDASNAAVISPQVGSYSLTFTGATGYDLSSFNSSGAIEQLVLEAAATSGTFDWTGGNGAATASIFRCTGVTAAQEAFATLAGTRGGTDGVYSLGTLTPVGGEVIITNEMIGTAAGGYTRSNVTLNFANDVATCQRLLVGANGTLSQLGDEND